MQPSVTDVTPLLRTTMVSQGVSNTQKKDTILFSALNLAGKSIFTPPRFFLSAVTQLPYKEIWGEGGVQNLRNFFEKCSER